MADEARRSTEHSGELADGDLQRGRDWRVGTHVIGRDTMDRDLQELISRGAASPSPSGPLGCVHIGVGVVGFTAATRLITGSVTFTRRSRPVVRI
jgi:hypothetical protein